jgi:hypothetical protein
MRDAFLKKAKGLLEVDVAAFQLAHDLLKAG